MGTIRIQGLVRAATRIRRELAGPISAQRLGELREEVAESIRAVDQILAEHGRRVDALPAPSRRAYEFLTRINLEGIETSESAPEEDYENSSVRLPGLKRFIEGVLDELTLADQPNLDAIQGRISRSSRNVERQLQAGGVEAQHLTEESRALRGWLAYFSDRENLDAYAAALGQARTVFEQAVKRSNRFQLPILIHFRPMKGLYRIRQFKNASKVTLPVPMLSFDAGDFTVLAEMVFAGSGDKQQIVEKTYSEPYQTILAELEALAGVIEQTAGVVHDLAASFGRVNATYFKDAMSRPRFTWSRTFTGREFGHYDPVRDTVMVSASLDDANVPEFVVDFVIYHELLHKKHGVRWNNGRRIVHTAEFQREERCFKQFSESEAVLNKLAGAHGRSRSS